MLSKRKVRARRCKRRRSEPELFLEGSAYERTDFFGIDGTHFKLTVSITPTTAASKGLSDRPDAIDADFPS